MAADVSSGQTEDEKMVLVTRDLLGGKSGDEKELWEKKFEFLSQKPYCSSEHDTHHVLHDLNCPPPPLPPQISYSSICTLEKVKIALDRAMRDPNPNPRPDQKLNGSTKRRRAIDDEEADGQDCSGRTNGGSMMVTVCPGCFQYLLVLKVDPRCPKCDQHVPVAACGLSKTKKKAKIDLNCATSLDK